MASDSPENPQYQLILHQSDIGGLSPQMQEILTKDIEIWTGSLFELQGRLKNYMNNFICLKDTNKHKIFFYKTTLDFKKIEILLNTKSDFDKYIDQFGPLGRRSDYIADVVRHTWNLALMKDEKEVSELIIVEGYFKLNGKVNGKTNFKLLGFRIFSSNHADVTN